MNITDIQTTVESFIDSIFPSISEILLLLLILVILLGTRRFIAFIRLITRRLSHIDMSPIKKLEEILEVKKFRPFIVIFVFLLFARSVHIFAYQVGNLVPGNLGYSQPSLLLSSVTTTEIVRVWSLYPKSEDILSLDAALEIEVQKAKLAKIPYVESSYISHEQRYSTLVGRVAYMKFLIIYIVAISTYFFGRNRAKRISFRATLLILLILVLIGYSFLESMQTLKQMNISKVYAAIYVQ